MELAGNSGGVTLDQVVAPRRGSAAWWNARYLSRDAPWDTGIVPPEVAALVASARTPRGWALDLGCGSGVSSRYLAQHGFRVVGVDLAHTALARARAAAMAESPAAYFCLADVGDLSFLHVRAALALDIGCFHSLPPERRPQYVRSLADHLLPGACYLLYAFGLAAASDESAPGVGPRDVAGFAPYFALCGVHHGRYRERASAWYLLRRTVTPLRTYPNNPARAGL